MSKDNGGPAFPRDGYQIEDEYGRKETIQGKSGMTLRDYFAAKAMQGMIASYGYLRSEVDVIAESAYDCADAMLKERAK